jgi:hypothetical protein
VPNAAPPTPDRLEVELAGQMWAWASSWGESSDKPAALMRRRLLGHLRGDPDGAERARDRLHKLLSEVLGAIRSSRVSPGGI